MLTKECGRIFKDALGATNSEGHGTQFPACVPGCSIFSLCSLALSLSSIELNVGIIFVCHFIIKSFYNYIENKDESFTKCDVNLICTFKFYSLS